MPSKKPSVEQTIAKARAKWLAAPKDDSGKVRQLALDMLMSPWARTPCSGDPFDYRDTKRRK